MPVRRKKNYQSLQWAWPTFIQYPLIVSVNKWTPSSPKFFQTVHWHNILFNNSHNSLIKACMTASYIQTCPYAKDIATNKARQQGNGKKKPVNHWLAWLFLLGLGEPINQGHSNFSVCFSNRLWKMSWKLVLRKINKRSRPN